MKVVRTRRKISMRHLRLLHIVKDLNGGFRFSQSLGVTATDDMVFMKCD